jgi:hypothetical protein
MELASLILKRRAGKVSDYPICGREPKNWVRNLRFEPPQIAAPALLSAWQRSDETVSQLRLRGTAALQVIFTLSPSSNRGFSLVEDRLYLL